MNTHTELSPTRFSDAAAAGLQTFPAKARSKEPAVAWKEYQTNAPSADQVAAWDRTDLNVAIVTGRASGIVVLDVDSPEAQSLVDELHLPLTPAVRTSRGQHLYFRYPNYDVRNSTNINGVKLDVRGEGGYVIAAGSIHPSGVVYEWITPPTATDFAKLPDRVRPLLEKVARDAGGAASPGATKLPSTGVAGLDRYLVDQLSQAQSDIESAEEGERNDNLFKTCARLARNVSAAGLDWAPFAAALELSATATGLPSGETGRTLNSGFKAGETEPTAWLKVAVEWVYLANQEQFYHLPSGTTLKPTGFNGQFGHLYWDRGSFAHYLLKADRVRKVHDLDYDPLCPDPYRSRDGREWLNTFKPSDIAAVEGDAGPFQDFVTGLIPQDEEREHLVRMMAFAVRFPGRRLRYALLLRTPVQGVGKSMLLNIWGRLLGRHNVRKTGSTELTGAYQSYLPQRLLVLCEELNLGVGARAYNELKDMITEDVVTVNEKYVKQREWRSYANFVFLTNLNRPLLIEPTDRRIFYISSPAQRREPGYYTQFAAWWQQNLGVIRGYLDRIDLSEFNPYEAPPMTEAKLRLIEESRSELAQEIALAIEEQRGCFGSDIVTLDQVRIELSRISLVRGSHQLMKALKEVGAHPLGQHRMVGLDDRQCLWAVRNVEYWKLTDRANRAEESRRSTGLFTFLDGAILLAHSSTYPGNFEAHFER